MDSFYNFGEITIYSNVVIGFLKRFKYVSLLKRKNDDGIMLILLSDKDNYSRQSMFGRFYGSVLILFSCK